MAFSGAWGGKLRTFPSVHNIHITNSPCFYPRSVAVGDGGQGLGELHQSGLLPPTHSPAGTFKGGVRPSSHTDRF